ncbi:MAG: hypothetical protein E2P02_04845 [Acidobacteria bacterium]|nr:MAG: hypothetical protein E2P02_04845 [Acidobacteriota bacterium]
MKLLFMSLAFVLLQTEQADELSELRERAETIIEDISSLEIDMVQASRKVQLLLKDLKKWGKTYDVELEVRARTHSTPAKPFKEVLTADRCALFFEKDLEELCPLDLSRSEVWGGEIVFCRYLCPNSGG